MSERPSSPVLRYDPDEIAARVVDQLKTHLFVPRVALRYPDEVAEALGVSRSWLYESGLAGELRFVRRGKLRLVPVRELEDVISRLSARWDE